MSRIGPYEIEQELGRGAMGFVLRCYDPSVGRHVALKLLLPQPSVPEQDRAEFKTRLVREATAIAKLAHPNIVGLYHVGEEPGFIYLVLEFVVGVDLAHRMLDGPLTPQSTLALLLQLAAALDHAHAHGIIHRDVKPANVLVQPDGIVKLTDFGIDWLPLSQLIHG